METQAPERRLRLALQIGVFGIRPGEHARLEIVEDEVAAAGAHRQHGVAVAVRAGAPPSSARSPAGTPSAISWRRFSSA